MNTKAWLMDDSEPWSTSQDCSLRWGQFDVNGASLCHNSSPIYCSALRAVLHIFYNNVQPFLLLALWHRSLDLSWLRTAPRSCLEHSNRSNPVNQSLFDIFLNRQIGLILRLSFQSFLMCKCRLWVLVHQLLQDLRRIRDILLLLRLELFQSPHKSHGGELPALLHHLLLLQECGLWEHIGSLWATRGIVYLLRAGGIRWPICLEPNDWDIW